MPTPDNYLALDFGEQRIGVAVASSAARLARPLVTLESGSSVIEQLEKIIEQQGVGTIVVGLPRNLSGESTAQTEAAKIFAKSLEFLGLPVHMQDEAVTSKKAEEELRTHGSDYAKADIDMLAATYILEDFLSSNGAARA